MTNISIGPLQFLIIGVPQGFLFVLAIYIMTRTKFDIKKYIVLSAEVSILTYMIRFLPISLGVNSMLSFLVLVVLFLITYKYDLQRIIRLIVSVISIFMFICLSELINELLLFIIFGKIKTQALLNSSSDLTKIISLTPTNIIFAVILLITFIILQKTKSKKEKYGETCEKTGR